MSQSVNGLGLLVDPTFNAGEAVDVTQPCFEKITQITNPPPSQLFVFLDENEDTLLDDQFGYPMINYGYGIWWDMPSNRHNQGADFSFADGHIEYWRWKVAMLDTLGNGQVGLGVTAAQMPDYVRVGNAMRQKPVDGMPPISRPPGSMVCFRRDARDNKKSSVFWAMWHNRRVHIAKNQRQTVFVAPTDSRLYRGLSIRRRFVAPRHFGRMNPFWLLFLSALSIVSARADNFDLRDGDRVSLIGDTFIEREQESGWLETVMHASFADRHVIVRNLGWSADTPAGESRASFDFNEPGKGLKLLTDEVAQVRPSVVMLGYGMASSFEGEAGLPQFKTDMERLIDAIQRDAKAPVRFVIISPLRHQKLPPPLPDPASHNSKLSQYTEALRQIAQARGFPVRGILFDARPAARARDLTDNGIHLTPQGYRWMAEETARQLGWQPRLKSADKNTVEQLRQEIVRKDQWFFDRWRPQNQTYLFGFRQHEQGQNGKEIPQFDPLIDTGDQRIFQWQECLVSGKTKPPSPWPVAPRPSKVPTLRRCRILTSRPVLKSACGPPLRCWPSRSK